MQETKQNKSRFGSMADALAKAGVVTVDQDGRYETNKSVVRQQLPKWKENVKHGKSTSLSHYTEQKDGSVRWHKASK